MKLEAHPRILAIQAANNFALSGIVLQGALRRILEIAKNEKDNVVLEISYYFVSLAQQLDND